MTIEKTIEYAPNGDMIVSLTGWCLVKDEEVDLTSQYGVIGGLFTCPHCGVLRERVEDEKHVFTPSKPLLEKLRS